MKNNVLIIGLMVAVIQTSVKAESIKFEDYPVQNTQGVFAKNIILKGKNQKYRTLLTELSKQEINFAGHYVLDSFGCGGGCQVLATYNAKTGYGFLHPQNFSDCYSQTHGFISRDYEFQNNSRLLVVTGSRSSKPYQCEKVYYFVHENSFKEIAQHWIYKSN